MAIALPELVNALNQLLQPHNFKDYCPNGLQVEGRQQIRRIATAVTASQNIVDQAVAAGADALLVHHGYFWKNEPAPVTGMKYRRLSALIKHDISLLAYHLPLDAHPELGNNAELARLMGWQRTENNAAMDPLVMSGQPSQPQTLAEIADRITATLGRTPLMIGDPERQVRKLAWCTGAAQGFIGQAAEAGCDLYISGEISENTVHAARELGIAYLAAGHHATERYGVQAVGRWLQQTHNLEIVTLDEENPV